MLPKGQMSLCDQQSLKYELSGPLQITFSLPGFSVHGILQAKILEWVAILFSRVSSQPRDQTRVSCTAGRFFTVCQQGSAKLSNNPWYIDGMGSLKGLNGKGCNIFRLLKDNHSNSSVEDKTER